MNTSIEMLTEASIPYHKSVLFPYYTSQIQSLFMSNTKSLHSSKEYLIFSKDHAFTVIKYPEVLLVLCHILHLSQCSYRK